MNVLYFHHFIKPSGASKSLSLLIRSLTQLGITATVVMQDRPGNEKVRSLFEEAGATVIKEQHLRPFHGSTVAANAKLSSKIYALAGYVPTLHSAKRLVRDLMPDIVHLNSTCLVAAGHGAHLARTGLPVIAHVREPILYNRWGGVLRWLNNRHVDHFISIDNAGDTSICGPASKRSVVYNSAGNSLFDLTSDDRVQARQRLGWDDDKITLLSLSRLMEANGALALAEAMVRIENRLSRPIRVVLAGFGPKNNFSAYERAVYHAISRGYSCEALPFTSDIAPLLAGCDAVIAPFLTSHSARSVFEGAAASRPALISRLPNLTELISEAETGISFVPGDDDSLLTAIEFISDETQRLRMGQQARSDAQNRFNEDQNAQTVHAIYARLLQPKEYTNAQ